MRDDKQYIIEQYLKVKALGFVESHRKNNTGIGKTFEDYMGVVENNLEAPDLAGFEIKSHRDESSSYTTLFTKAPDFPLKANAMLLRRFGIPNEDNPILKKLHTSMFATKNNTFMGIYSFRLLVDRAANVIKIGVFDIKSQNLLDDSVGYNFSTIERILINKKLHNLFYVSADRKFQNGKEWFYFKQAEIYTQPSLEKFIQLVEKGMIMYDIRMGCYKSGEKIGMPHDHGSGFRILEPNIRLLYETKESVE